MEVLPAHSAAYWIAECLNASERPRAKVVLSFLSLRVVTHRHLPHVAALPATPEGIL